SPATKAFFTKIKTIATRQNNRAAPFSFPSSNKKNKTGNRTASPAKSSNAQRNTAQTTLIPIFLSARNNKQQFLFNLNLLFSFRLEDGMGRAQMQQNRISNPFAQ